MGVQSAKPVAGPFCIYLKKGIRKEVRRQASRSPRREKNNIQNSDVSQDSISVDDIIFERDY